MEMSCAAAFSSGRDAVVKLLNDERGFGVVDFWKWVLHYRGLGTVSGPQGLGCILSLLFCPT